MKLRNIVLALKDQLPLLRLLKNVFKGNLKGLFHIRSHVNRTGIPKIVYGSKISATKAAAAMAKKKGCRFDNYKCVHCDGFHIGNNSASKPPEVTV